MLQTLKSWMLQTLACGQVHYWLWILDFNNKRNLCAVPACVIRSTHNDVDLWFEPGSCRGVYCVGTEKIKACSAARYRNLMKYMAGSSDLEKPETHALQSISCSEHYIGKREFTGVDLKYTFQYACANMSWSIWHPKMLIQALIVLRLKMIKFWWPWLYF